MFTSVSWERLYCSLELSPPSLSLCFWFSLTALFCYVALSFRLFRGKKLQMFVLFQACVGMDSTQFVCPTPNIQSLLTETARKKRLAEQSVQCGFEMKFHQFEDQVRQSASVLAMQLCHVTFFRDQPKTINLSVHENFVLGLASYMYLGYEEGF